MVEVFKNYFPNPDVRKAVQCILLLILRERNKAPRYGR